MPFKPGDRVGRYEIRAEIGSGAMGHVFHAHDSRLDRAVALKLIVGDREHHPQARARFEQEARSASALNHPNIVTTYDIGEESGRLFIVMELLEGQSLRRMLSGPMPVDLLMRVGAQIAEALAAAHEHGIIHRDLKPENIFLTRQEVAKILDFGLAMIRPVDRDSISSGTLQRVTTEGRVVGTAGYAAPEVLSGSVVDHRADIFSLGAILYEMACGAPAFRGMTSVETLASTLRDEVTPPMRLRPELPLSLGRLIMRCLQKDPRERYATIADVRDELRILTSTAPAAPASTRKRKPLPAARTELIGRQNEIERVTSLFVAQRARLVTLTGPGGSGKTRLAIALAAALQPHFKDEVYFVPLATMTDPRQVPAAIAEAMGTVSGPNQAPLAAVVSELNVGATPTLLILDNFEQIMGAANMVSELLAACPPLSVMITSREVLRLYGEHDFEVLPLALPEEDKVPIDVLASVPAIALFVARATAVDPAFRFGPENVDAVVEVCRRLDGLPLAIELAAARVRMLPPRALLGRLNQRLQILTAGARDLPDRQSTLRRTIDWSYGLLNPGEQTLFRRLGIFAGSFTLEGAEAVADPFGKLGVEIVDGISSLVDKSLLHKEEDAQDGDAGFAMLETIREYAAELLSNSEDEQATRKAHAAYFLVIAEEAAQVLATTESVEWLTRLTREHDNLWAALQWLVRTQNAAWAVRMGVALFSFWEDTDHLSEGRRALNAIMQLPGAREDERSYARLLFCAGVLASIQGDNAEAIARNEMGLALYQRRNDQWGIAVSRNALGLQHIEIGDIDRAASHLQASLAAWKNAGDKSGYARSLSNLALVRRLQGNPTEARKLYDEAAQLFVRIGDRTSGAWALNQQGDVAREQMQLDDAERHYKSAIEVFRDLDDQWGVASCIADLGTVARRRGDMEGAADFYRQALAIFSALGHRRGVARILELMSVLAASLGHSERTLTLSSAAARFRETIGVPGPVSEQQELASAVEQASTKLSSVIADEARRRGYGMTLTEAIRYAEGQE